MVKNMSANTGDTGDVGSIPGSRFAGGGTGNSLQYSCLENSVDRGPWQATTQRIFFPVLWSCQSPGIKPLPFKQFCFRKV